MVYKGNNIFIEENKFYNTSYSGIYTGYNYSNNNVFFEDIFIRNNLFENNMMNLKNGGGITLFGGYKNGCVEYNTLLGSGIYFGENALGYVIRENSINTDGTGINMWSELTHDIILSGNDIMSGNDIIKGRNITIINQ